MSRWCVALTLLAACGRVAFDRNDDAGADRAPRFDLDVTTADERAANGVE